MHFNSRIALLLAAFGLIASAANGSTRTCVSSTTEGFSISPEYAAVGSNPLYKGSDSTANNPLYSRTSGGTVITLTGSNYDCVGTPAVSANGAIVSQIRAHNQGHVQIGGLSLSGPPVILADGATGDASGSPVCTADGTVVFKSISNGQPVLLTKAPGSQIIGTLPGWDFATINSVACSPRGDLIVAGTTASNSTPAAYVGSIGGGLPGSLPDTSNLSLPSISDACYGLIVTNSTTKLADFVIAPRDPQSGQATGRRTYTAGRFALECSIACDQGSDLVAMCDSGSIKTATSRDVSSGLPTGKLSAALAVSPNTLISVGDPLGGGTVTGLSLSPQAFTGSGELMFWASIVDTSGNSSNGLFAITVPEPATFGALASAGLLAIRRRGSRA